jgi:flagellar basal-body rod protein FlgG
MMTNMHRMDITTNNIANVDTTGYKADKVASQSFTEELMKRVNDPTMTVFKTKPVGKMSMGVFIDDIYTNFANGSLRQTYGQLDIALSGNGFFCVNVNGTEQYTRDGSFKLAPDGTLVTDEGGRVQGENGDIVIPYGNVSVDEYGSVYVNDQFIDRLKLTDFTDKHMLRKQADNFYISNGAEQQAFTGQVVQGYLENSNVNSVREMVDLIALSRAYETNSRMVTIVDQTLQRAVNDIARRG